MSRWPSKTKPPKKPQRLTWCSPLWDYYQGETTARRKTVQLVILGNTHFGNNSEKWTCIVGRQSALGKVVNIQAWVRLSKLESYSTLVHNSNTKTLVICLGYEIWLWLLGRRNSSLQKLQCPGVWRWVGSGSPRAHWGPTAPVGWEHKALDTGGTGLPRALQALGRAGSGAHTLTHTETWKGAEAERVRSVYQFLSCWSKVDANRKRTNSDTINRAVATM